MTDEDHKKAILNSEHPRIQISSWCFYMIEKNLSKEEMLQNVREFCNANQKSLKIEKDYSLGGLVQEMENFRPWRQDLIQSLKADRSAREGKSDRLHDLILKLFKQGNSKEKIYDIFLTFFSYLQYKHYELKDPDYEEPDADWIADNVLDGLWGGGWDKGNRILPDEPDVAEIKRGYKLR